MEIYLAYGVLLGAVLFMVGPAFVHTGSMSYFDSVKATAVLISLLAAAFAIILALSWAVKVIFQ
jgi:hypothetical protein